MRPPRTIQCGDCREFKGAVLHILQYHGINSNPHHLRSQGPVEQGNSVREQKLRASMAGRGTRQWLLLLVTREDVKCIVNLFA